MHRTFIHQNYLEKIETIVAKLLHNFIMYVEYFKTPTNRLERVALMFVFAVRPATPPSRSTVCETQRNGPLARIPASRLEPAGSSARRSARHRIILTISREKIKKIRKAIIYMSVPT